MGHQKIKVDIHFRSWKTAMVIGFLFGIVVGTAPQYIGLLIMATIAMGTLILLNRGRI